MAVNINTVYQTVLAVANKEQRGYITPQEFNLFANQAQMDIFEQYFYDLNQFNRVPGNETEYSDMVNILNEKINLFATVAECNDKTSDLTQGTVFGLPNTSTDFYRLGTVKFGNLSQAGVNLCTDPFFTSTGSNLIASDDAFGTDNQAANLAFSTSSLFGASNSTHKVSTYSSISKDKTYKFEFTLTNSTGATGEGVFHLLGETASSIGSVNNAIYYGQSAAFGNGGNRDYSFIIRPDAGLPQGVGTSGGFAASNTGKLMFKAFSSGGFGGTITSMSLKEVGTSWTITPTDSWEIGDKANATGGVATSASQTWQHNDNDASDRGNKCWAKDPYGNIRTAGFLQNTMSLSENKNYMITYTIVGATTGKLFLSDCVADDIIENEVDGTFKNLLLYDAAVNTPGTFTKNWKQGANNTDKISIYHNDTFNGAITNISIEDQTATLPTVEVERVSDADLENLLSSNLAAPTTTRPIYTRKGNDLFVYPTDITYGIMCNYIRKPKTPHWGYTEINGAALYNAGTSMNFELHESEEIELGMKILQLAGVAIKDPNLYQAAHTQDIQNTQQEKQ